MQQIEENPDDGESILAELAAKGVIDDISLAVATAESTEKFETIDIMEGAGPYRAPKKYFHLTKSVDRHSMDDEFVFLNSLIIYRGNKSTRQRTWCVVLSASAVIAKKERVSSENLKLSWRETCRSS